MKKFLSVLCMMLLFGSIWAKDCKITYENEGFLMVIMNTSFQSIENGSTVPEGTNLLIALSCNNGYSLESFLINGVEHKDELSDYAQEGRDFQYTYTVTEDTHFEAISKTAEFPVVYTTTGGGTLELTAGEKQLQSGDMVEYGMELTIKANPDEGSEIVSFRINDEDNLDNLKKNGNQLTMQVYSKTVVEAEFTNEGQDTENTLPVTWTVEGAGNLTVKCGNQYLASGDKVIKGDYIDVWVVAEENYSISSLKVNGEEYIDSLTNKLSLQVQTAINMEAVFTENERQQMWIDMAADSFDGGDGTEQNPYRIATAGQLAKIAKDIYDGTTDYTDTWFGLTADIDLAGHEWFPIGVNSLEYGEKTFNGKVKGNNFKILNLTINPVDEHTATGLFGATGSNFELHDLTIESGNILGNMIVGAFAGFNRGLIDNCVNKAKVACIQFYCGGIAGSNSRTSDDNLSAIIRRCQNYGTVIAGNGGANGISAAGIAASTSSIIEECANWGTISAPTSSAGGITAVVEGGTVRHCFNRGSITSSEQVAGIAASVLGRSGDCEIYNCYNASQLNASVAESDGAIIGVALFQDTKALKAADSYYDTSLYGGSGCGAADDYFGSFEIKNLTGMDTEEMKSAEFAALLNSETRDGNKWAADKEGLNDGYPVFAFMTSDTSAVSMPRMENNIEVYAAKGHINIKGAASDDNVRVFTTTGTMAFTGTTEKLYDRIFEKGIYIIFINGKTYKVALK